MKNRGNPTLGIFRERRNIDYFEFKAPHYELAHFELYKKLLQKGIQLAILMGQSTYVSGNQFSRHWQVVFEKRLSPKFLPAGAVEPNLILVKDELKFDERASTLNNSEIIEIAANKQRTYELFSDLQPTTFVAKNKSELAVALDKLAGDSVVVKGFYGNSGQTVEIGLKEDVLSNKWVWPVQAQEFVDTSGGIPGLVEGRHDLRVIMANNQPILGKIRTPPRGGLKSNTGYGGNNWLIAVDSLPRDVLSLTKSIDNRLSSISPWRLYSIDLGLTNRGYRLFELNDKPGVVSLSQGEPATFYQNAYVDFLVNATKWYAERAL
ncbi:MAG TPA: hypothetical protein VGA08_02915 [Candidatus Saccharimonadales bacterium]